MLRQSLPACEAWRRAGRPLGLAVNLSPRSLLEPDFVDEVARALAAVEVPASAVTFEITESSLMADPERAILALRRLRDLGVRLSIDDLGTGYSSLAYLQRLPVTRSRSTGRSSNGPTSTRATTPSPSSAPSSTSDTASVARSLPKA